MHINKRVFKLALKIICSFTVFLLLISAVLFTQQNVPSTPIDGKILRAIMSKKTSVILFWNGFFRDSRWTLPVDTLHAKCPNANCIITNQVHYLSSVEDYAAIIFHTARSFSLLKSRPRQRAAHQFYVFAQLESPEHTWHNLNAERNFYNLTMTYRLDSDIVWSYNVMRAKETEEIVAPRAQVMWRNADTSWTQNNTDLLLSIGRKKKLAAWFVSNCKVPSRREKLVKQLQAHLPVDVYGKCGNLSCARFDNACDELLDTDYKFYFSFENSICLDYVTEKFYNALRRQIVPVVFGGANYTLFAPPHSYIDVQDFKNVSSLANYLKYLDGNPLEYAKYFWWRRYYTVDTFKGGLQTLPYCELCQRIQTHPAVRQTQIYEDINAFWNENICTTKGRIEF
ncbi:alpha-(1,3)-fucosyltransferase C [Ceratitis capitata]|uniref:Fucosyltransferase n=1 Tax=Ceratitis capitata TaxID=7213 RepID=W8BAD3_CERCA|nr:alpha-(1,3)-fucosyltransferase C [Ceratitis capitata]